MAQFELQRQQLREALERDARSIGHIDCFEKLAEATRRAEMFERDFQRARDRAVAAEAAIEPARQAAYLEGWRQGAMETAAILRQEIERIKAELQQAIADETKEN